MLAGVVQVGIHLSCVGASEFAKFQFDNDQASKPSMEEEHIDPIPLCAHSQSLLTSNESKNIAQLTAFFWMFANALVRTLGVRIVSCQTELANVALG